MKKLLHVLILVFAFSTSSCAAWWQELRTNPVQALTEATNYITIALRLAEGAFNAWAASNPQNTEAVATFRAITTDVENGLAVAQAGLRVAADAHQTPDVAVLMRDSQAAMGRIATFLAGLQSPHPMASPRMAQAILHARRAAVFRALP